MQVPVFQIDAFTSVPFGGNPAAVCLLDSWLDDELLRKVAAEFNLSATAFLVRATLGYELRWFTPVCEIRLCGHATLAAGYVVLNFLKSEDEEVWFATRFGGKVGVRREAGLYAMDFPALVPKKIGEPSGLREALGMVSPPVEVVEANETYIAVLPSPESILALQPNFDLLARLHPFAVAVTAPGEDVDFVSRYFAPSYGVPEDPATGSLHCALAPFWAKRFDKSQLRARQLSERGGELSCEVNRDRVVIRGSAVLVRRAEFDI